MPSSMIQDQAATSWAGRDLVPLSREPGGERPPLPPAASDGWRLALLLLATTVLHAWLIATTVVTARDGVGFIRYAVLLESRPWAEVIRATHQHPGFPAAILAMSRPVRAVGGLEMCDAMVLSGQLASALAGILLIFPMYYLGRELFDRSVGFWAAALFQCLPVKAQVSADALSDAPCLLLAATALLLGVRGVRRGSAGYLFLCGLAGGLAYLVRPEGALVVVAAGLVLIAMQLRASWRQPWRKGVLRLAALGLGAILAASPYVLTTGRLSNKPTAQGVLETAEVRRKAPACGGPARRPVLACIPAVWWTSDPLDARTPPWWWGGLATLRETARAFQYVAWLPALLGLWWLRRRLGEPGCWVPLALCLVCAAVLWRMGQTAGYVSERHTLLIVLCGTFWAVAGTRVLGQRLARRLWPDHPGRLFPVQVGLLTVLVLAGLPSALKPLHAGRAGHRQAGLWLARNSQPGDVIIDPATLAMYYSGRLFPAAPLEAAAAPSPTYYFVLEQRARPAHREPVLPVPREVVEAQGKVVFRCPLGAERRPEDEVVIYAVSTGR